MGSSDLGQRWKAFGTSIFTVMSQMAARAGAVNLAQGFPDFDGPHEIKEAAIAAIREGRNQYAPAHGIAELRQLLSERQQRQSGIAYNMDTEVTVLSGATEAIFSTLVGLLAPGDEVVSFAPFYDCYPAAVKAAGALFKTVNLQAPDWSFDLDSLKQAITSQTKMILLNTPHNPTGKVFTKSELEAVAALAKQHDLVVVTDEVYEEIIFDNATHVHMAALPGMRERTVTISSTSKTFSMTGWKIGYLFASPQHTQAIRGIHQFTVFCSATPLQWGMVAGLKLGDDYYSTFRHDYTLKRNYLVEILNGCGIKTSLPKGTYFAVGDYSQINQGNDLTFATWLTEHIKIAAIPLSPFFLDQEQVRTSLHYLRFAFCKNQETLEKAAEKLRKLSG